MPRDEILPLTFPRAPASLAQGFIAGLNGSTYGAILGTYYDSVGMGAVSVALAPPVTDAYSMGERGAAVERGAAAVGAVAGRGIAGRGFPLVGAASRWSVVSFDTLTPPTSVLPPLVTTACCRHYNL